MFTACQVKKKISVSSLKFIWFHIWTIKKREENADMLNEAGITLNMVAGP